jgi:hypothetical protein
VSRNLLPLPGLSVGPNPAVVGQPVTLDASSSTDPDGSVVKYEWDLDGNGTFETPGGSTPTISYTYPNPGAYDVGVRVTDNDGGTAVARVRLVVNPPPPPPGGGGVGAGAPPPDTGGAPGAGGGSVRLTAELTGLPIQRVRAVLVRGLAVGCGANRATSCSLTATMAARDARRLGMRSRRPIALGSAVLRLPRAGKVAGWLRLTPAGARALRRARSVTIVVRGTAVDALGARVSLTRAFLLRR